MVHYQVLIADKEYPFTSLQYERSYKLQSQPFTIVLPVVENIASLSTVEINRDDELVYKGKIYKIGKTIHPHLGKHFVLRGFDLKHKLPFLPSVGEEYGELWGRPTGTDLKNHVNDQLANSDLTAGTLNNTGKTYPVIFGTPNSKFNRRQAIQSICEIVGWECWTTPVGLLFFASQIQADRTNTIRFKRGELLQSWIDPFKLLANHKVEKITVAGHNIGDLMAKGSAQTGGYGVGSREATFNLRYIKTDAACDDAATALLADIQNDVYCGRFEAIDTFDGHAYDVGDLIKVVDDEFSVDGNYRISSIERWFDAERVETTRIGITNISKLTLNGPYLLDPGEKAIIDGYMGVDELGKIVHFTDSRALTSWLIKRHVFHDSFEKIDGDVWTKTGTGTVAASKESGLPCAEFTTTGGGTSYAKLETTNAYWGNAKWRLNMKLKLSTADNISLEFGAYYWLNADNNGRIYFYYYDLGATRYLKAHCQHWVGGVGGGTLVEITPTPDMTAYHEFMCERVGANKAHFWIDGEMVKEITTNITTWDMPYRLELTEQEAAVKKCYIRAITAQALS